MATGSNVRDSSVAGTSNDSMLPPPQPGLRSFSAVAASGRSADNIRPGSRRRYSFRSRPLTDSSRHTTSRILVPTADHGVIIDTSNYQYTTPNLVAAIKLVVPPHQIHSFGRMQGCFHIYFLDKSWSLQLRTNGLTMPDNVFVPCQPVGAPPTRVIVSDVPTHFENVYLREIMSDFGQVVGPIRTLRAAYTDPDMPTILSFRRQVYLKFATTQARAALPERIFVDYDDAPLTFFLSIDLKCHVCHETGHLRSHCPTTRPDNASSTTTREGVDAQAPSSDDVAAFDLTPIQPVLDPVLDPAHTIRSPPAGDSHDLLPTDSPSALPSTNRGPSKRTADSASDSPAHKKTPSLAPSTAQLSTFSDTLSQGSDIADADVHELMDTAHPTVTALSHSDLAALFDRMKNSPLSPVVHIRQFTDDVPGFVRQLIAIRSDPVAHANSPLSRFTKGALYQWIRKISKASNEESLPTST